MNWLELLSVALPGLVSFGRYVVLSMLAKAVSDYLRKLLVKYEHDAQLVWSRRHVIALTLAKAVVPWLKKQLVETEHEAAAWLRFKHKAMTQRVN